MFTIIKGNYINLANVTYFTKSEENEITINFAGSSDNYVRILFDSKEEADLVMLRLCGGHIGNIM